MILLYFLGLVPQYLAHPDGILRKTVKSPKARKLRKDAAQLR